MFLTTDSTHYVFTIKLSLHKCNIMQEDHKDKDKTKGYYITIFSILTKNSSACRAHFLVSQHIFEAFPFLT